MCERAGLVCWNEGKGRGEAFWRIATGFADLKADTSLANFHHIIPQSFAYQSNKLANATGLVGFPVMRDSHFVNPKSITQVGGATNSKPKTTAYILPKQSAFQNNHH